MHEPLPHRSTIAGTERHIFHRDIESLSRVDLRTVGADKYAADPSTDVYCYAYAVDDGPVKLWIRGDPVPAEAVEAAKNPTWSAAAHGDHFETVMERHILAPRYGLPLVPVERHVCTMAMCLAVGLPAKLETAADALELANRKDIAGGRLMHQMSKPRRAHKDEDPAGTYWFEDPERLDRLYSYCKQDVEVERELFERLPPLSPAEHVLWSSQLPDQRARFLRRSRICRSCPPDCDGGGTGNQYRACRAHRRRRHWHQSGRTAPTMAAAERLHFKEARP